MARVPSIIYPLPVVDPGSCYRRDDQAEVVGWNLLWPEDLALLGCLSVVWSRYCESYSSGRCFRWSVGGAASGTSGLLVAYGFVLTTSCASHVWERGCRICGLLGWCVRCYRPVDSLGFSPYWYDGIVIFGCLMSPELLLVPFVGMACLNDL